jgi:hypothetical protein
LYFDLIRNGAEQNFLRLMPANSREDYLDDWYQSSGKFKMWLDYEAIDDDKPTGLKLDPKDPKRDFAMQLLARYGDLNARPDPINRCDGAYCSRPNIDPALQNAEQALSRLTSRPAAGLKVIDQLPEATMLRIERQRPTRGLQPAAQPRAQQRGVPVGRVAALSAGLDTLTIYPGVLSSYPNFMFNIPAEQVRSLSMPWKTPRMPIASRKSSNAGGRRSHPQFWFFPRPEPVHPRDRSGGRGRAGHEPLRESLIVEIDLLSQLQATPQSPCRSCRVQRGCDLLIL